MDIDALRQAHEKLKRKSQRQRDRIKELEGKDCVYKNAYNVVSASYHKLLQNGSVKSIELSKHYFEVMETLHLSKNEQFNPHKG